MFEKPASYPQKKENHKHLQLFTFPEAVVQFSSLMDKENQNIHHVLTHTRLIGGKTKLVVDGTKGVIE